MMLVEIETFQEFSMKHSEPDLGPLRIRGRLVFPDGSWTLDSDGNFRGTPTPGSYDCMQSQRQYFKHASTNAVNEFSRVHRQFGEMAAMAQSGMATCHPHQPTR